MGRLIVDHWAAPAPAPHRLLGAATPDDRPFVLASGPGDPRLTRWSYCALEARASFTDLAEAIRSIANFERDPRLPFSGGVVGYLGYDLGWTFVKKPRPPRPDPLGLPGARFHVYDAVYAYDHHTQEGWLAHQGTPESARHVGRLREALIDGPLVKAGQLAGALRSRVSQSAHEARVEALLEAIRAGDVYQANLSYALEGRYRGHPGAAFLRLLEAPPPFASFFDLGEGLAIVSASPECFFDLHGPSRKICTYPIKGTRRRADDPVEDRLLAEALAGDDKERAEHLMIVDLLRNDLGRVAEVGSVGVDGLAYVESFPTVHHLTSRVHAVLRQEVDVVELLSAMFPGGSITGAPKLRAMELIDALEDEARGVYTGAILYAGPDGSIRSSIAIRTASFAGEDVRFGVGGGIVADSSPGQEWTETELKAKALGRALAG